MSEILDINLKATAARSRFLCQPSLQEKYADEGYESITTSMPPLRKIHKNMLLS
jgi:hypothetical protein